MLRKAVALVALCLAAAIPAPALADEYAPGSVPSEPSSSPKPSGRVLHVRPHGRGIQAAVDRSRAGDTIRVARGTYRGAVEIRGASKRGLRLEGDGATLAGALRIRDTGTITVRGLRVRGAGIALRDVDRYVLEGVRVSGSRAAGIDARRSPGGTIARVLTAGNAGADIALGAVPARPRALRTFVRESTVRGNATGIVVDGARATTISRVRAVGNDVGVRLTGAADLVLRDNDVRSNRVGVAVSGGSGLVIEANRFLADSTDVLVIHPPEP